jgi:hypothetical protein
MRRKLLLFVLTVVLLVSNAFVAAAKPLQWQDATVLVGGGLPSSAARSTLALYWIKTDKITYVVSNVVSDYSRGLFLERWLVLTAGGPTKIAIAGRNIHILDEEGKDRTVRVVWKIATKP